MKHYSALIISALITLALCACAPFKPMDQRAAVCNELNSQMIFGGSTNNTRKAEIENAQAPLIQHQYDKKCEQ